MIEYDPTELYRALSRARSVAVLGAHPDPTRPANFVPTYMHEHGYRVVGVNPAHVGEIMWGERVRASLAAIGEPMDIVCIFRKAESIPLHLDALLAMRPRPRVIWMQQGIRNEEVAESLRGRGFTVVQDRCMMADHKALVLDEENAEDEDAEDAAKAGAAGAAGGTAGA